MAQATADVVGLQAEVIRKDKVLPTLFHENDVFFSQIATRKDVIKVSSRDLRIPLKMRPGSRFGSINLAGGATGRGTGSKYDKATLTPIACRVAVEINQDVLDQTDGEPKAIRKILALEIASAMQEMRVQLNGTLQTAGDGILATLTTVAGTTLTMANAPFYTQLLRERQKVSVYDATLATKRGEAEILTLDHPNNQAVIDALPAGTIATDVLLPEGVSGANPAWFFGIPYLQSAAATGTWLGFNRANEPAIRASRVDNSGNALTTPPIRLCLSKILQRIGKKFNPKSLKAHLHTTQKSAYEELAALISEIHKTSGNEDIDLFFSGAKLAGVPAEVDIQAARDRIDFISLDNWGRAESAPIDFLKLPDGRYFTRPIDTTTGSPVAALLFHIYWFGQFFLDNPAAAGYIDNLNVTTGYNAM